MNNSLSGRIVLVGPAPSLDCDPNIPLSIGRSNRGTGACLLRLLDMDTETFHVAFERHFLIPLHQGRFRGRGGDRFPRKIARKAAELMVGRLKERTVVLIGKKVARAFSVEKTAPFEWIVVSGATMSWAPNPSGMNHWWNDQANRKAGEAFFSALGQRALNSTLRGLAA
jgi:hypothetical protein